MSTRRRLRFFAGLTALIVGSASAHADAIDGEWCRGPDNFKIDGSTILTTGRNTIQGDYFRYRFNYVIPATEPGAGGDVKMVMIRGPERVELTRPGTPDGQPEVWTRCKPVS
jgi:hypothetical protein